MPEDGGGDRRSQLEQLRDQSRSGRRHDVDEAATDDVEDGAVGADVEDVDTAPAEAPAAAPRAGSSGGEGDVDGTLVDAVAAGFERLEADSQPNLSFRDERVAALMLGLEEQPERMAEIGVTLQEHLGDDPDPEGVDRSELLRLSFRAAVYSAAPELADVVHEAQARHLADQF